MPTSDLKLAIISDTHVGDRSVELAHPEMWDAIEQAELTIHAGDWTSLEFYDEVKRRANGLIGVRGNNDPELGFLAEEAKVTIEGLRFIVTHIPPRLAEFDERFPWADVVVFGHTHRVHDSVSPAGRRLLNPGSTINYERWAGGSNMMTGRISWENGELEVWTHRLRNADRPIVLWP